MDTELLKNSMEHCGYTQVPDPKQLHVLPNKALFSFANHAACVSDSTTHSDPYLGV